MSRSEIRVGGLGGQGVILCGTIIGKAASIYDHKHSGMIQSFGPEARGSSCSAQVILSDEVIGYPYVRNLDVLVAMSNDACHKFLPELKKDGVLLYEEELVSFPEGTRPAKAWGIPATRFAEELGRKLVLNIVMVGFFAGVTGLVSRQAAEAAVRDSVPAGTEGLNLKAFARGYEYGRELVGGAA
ncbi:MAG TPA: 2-oxoacid:acceptor oxidoreductase family protein [Myxococcota bacterium]|nr:2-oxoacid:acceptor oxidoreductase family protein [Myxococcota bacterium]HOA12359.1 2-oxoacid:acceptor oxidoreductase family protein [Myxococcota bacterium]HOC99975.1 2-oxoacid:acceptor oxidoreductase family protein [Myxococcota bacterium]HOH75664.1 2-oxoacid:acceptor oxidoreductase family protein [Myxococcota bacterium]HPV03866.1 2-oxoacid:acceptor oxidoreductase family protein [Myxococcota bacterium]